ncbi:hypothetical protein [Streptomonospora alba]|nr:hypothetical protein [Streptomonospora alba]
MPSFHIVDAFADTLFAGSPAVLDELLRPQAPHMARRLPRTSSPRWRSRR